MDYIDIPTDAREDYEKLKGLFRVIFGLYLLFAVTGSFSRLSIMGYADKAIMAAACILMAAAISRMRLSVTSFLVLITAVLLHMISLLYPLSPQEGVATYFMFAFWVLFWVLMSSAKSLLLEVMQEMRVAIKRLIVVWDLLMVVALFMPSCYRVGWGGARYFSGYTTGSFEVVPIAMFILSLVILVYRLEGRAALALALSTVPLACAFAGGTRTYLVVMLFEELILLRLVIHKDALFVLVVAASLVAVVYIVTATNIGQKFSSASIVTDDTRAFLTVLTNGRNVIWEVDVDAFLAGDTLAKLFGHGFSYVYDINQIALGKRVYAHNDFINILLNFGVVGLIVYLAVLIPVIRRVRVRSRDTFIYLAFAAMWLFNAMFNMIYVYAVAVLATGTLFIAVGVDADGDAARITSI